MNFENDFGNVLRQYKTDFNEEKENDFGNVSRRYKTDFREEKMTLAMFCGDIKLILAKRK